MRLFRKITNYYSHIILFTVLSLLAFMSVKSYNTHYEQYLKKINNVKDEITIECTINSYPQTKNGKIQARGRIDYCTVPEINGQNLLLKFPFAKADVNMGDKVRLTGRLEIAQGASNPGSFDYKEYLKSLSVIGICTIDNGKPEILSRCAKLPRAIYNLRQRFTVKSDELLSSNASGLLRAIIGGDRTEISPDDEDGFKKSGIYHIVAISGLHLNIFICAVYAYIRRLKIKRKYRAILSVLSCLAIGLFVMIFTGFGVSVIRAFIMASILSLSSLASRHYSSKNSLILTGFIMVISTPYCFYSVAFQLSFLSTLGVLLALDFLRFLKERQILPIIYKNYLGKTFCISVFTTVSTLFVTINSFGFIPLYSWIANALILPIMPYLLGTGAVFTAFVWFLPPWLISLVGYFITGLYAYISFVSQIVSSLYGATLSVYSGTLLYFIICIICLFWGTFLFFTKGIKRALSAMLIFAVAAGGFLVYNVRDTDEITVAFADVGQGDCALMQSGTSAIMIDCGTSSSLEYYASSIDEMLRYKNIKKLDTAIVTHYHTDHTNIMEKLLGDGKIRRLVLPAYYDFKDEEARENKDRLLYAAVSSNTEISYAKGGDRILWDDDKNIEFLLPESDMFSDSNNMSLIAKLTYGKTAFLFCGDAETEELEKCMGKDIACDVIKISHHGGYCDGADAFIKKAKPEIAAISCSKYNRYNHPDDRLIKILENESCDIKRTDRSGAIIIKASKEKILSAKEMR